MNLSPKSHSLLQNTHQGPGVTAASPLGLGLLGTEDGIHPAFQRFACPIFSTASPKFAKSWEEMSPQVSVLVLVRHSQICSSVRKPGLAGAASRRSALSGFTASCSSPAPSIGWLLPHLAVPVAQGGTALPHTIPSRLEWESAFRI